MSLAYLKKDTFFSTLVQRTHLNQIIESYSKRNIIFQKISVLLFHTLFFCQLNNQDLGKNASVYRYHVALKFKHNFQCNLLQILIWKAISLKSHAQFTIAQSVYILEWTCPSFPLGELETFCFFLVTHIFQGELYRMKVIYLTCLKVLTKLSLHI